MRAFSAYNYVWKCIILAATFLLINSTAFTNSSSYYDKDGSSVIPIENKNIRMEKEVVKIRADHDNNNEQNGYGIWLADCVFIFVNTSEIEETVTMGYPDWLNDRYEPDKYDTSYWNYFDSLPEKPNRNDIGFILGSEYSRIYFAGYRQGKVAYRDSAWKLHDLKVLVNNRQVKVVHKPINIQIQVSESKGRYVRQPEPPVGTYIWKMRFKPKEVIKVQVTFSFSGLTDVGGYQQVAYLLRTGALWADTIGTADIYWNATGRSVRLAPGTPPVLNIENNVLHWHFENIEPSADIILWADLTDYVDLMRMAFRSKKYEGNIRIYTAQDLKPTVEERGEPDEKKMFIKTLRNEIFARHGRTFTSEDLKAIFTRCDWYKPNDKFTESMLNEYEMQNVKFLLNYEKQQGWQ